MGIRVHKTLGYGLTDVKCEKYDIVDERFSPEAQEKIMEHPREWEVKEYIKWLEAQKYTIKNGFEQKLELNALKASKERFNIGSCFEHSAEYGLARVFLVTPASHLKEWCQYDNIIDYYQEEGREGETLDWWKGLKWGIYPYGVEVPACVQVLCEFAGIFKDKETIKTLKPMLYTHWG